MPGTVEFRAHMHERVYVLKSTSRRCYICFHVFGDHSNGFRSGWCFENLHSLLTSFSTKKEAQETINRWQVPSQPLPADVVPVLVETFTDEHGIYHTMEIPEPVVVGNG